MHITRVGDDIEVDEARRFEMISTALFEMPSPWLSFANVEATAETISGQFTIRARNGTFTYRLTGWCSWIPHVALAELIDGQVIHMDVRTHASVLETTDAPPLEQTTFIPRVQRRRD